ncbi:hypothetical protein M422DRAFT_264637 [Sphaerobolus stellatus SS14]|uniref:DUF8205 domain-containing protein n=1 Tax=Sphaerobolus stellatus (strain SS14) TaxID=990650 RepID=A0A0C9V7J8_SPHS4|nr:hypothetical protein M422DRAFT_264637 [Sphaerobolus stellatus SS14]
MLNLLRDYRVGKTAKNTEGMVQINELNVKHIPVLIGPRRKVWEETKNRLGNEAKMIPVALIAFRYHCDQTQGMAVTLPITPEAFEVAQDKEPTVVRQVDAGGVAKEMLLPVSPYAVLERMNLHIRNDSENQLRLRTRMTDTEKNIIAGTAHTIESITSNEAATVILLEKKMRRESIYVLNFAALLSACNGTQSPRP